MDIWKRERPAFKLPNKDTRPSVFASKSAEKNKHSHFSALKLICCISIIILSFAISGCMFGTKSNTGMAFPMVSIRGTFENVAEITLRIYVANSVSDSVTVIDGSTDTVVTTVTVGTTPYLLDVMP